MAAQLDSWAAPLVPHANRSQRPVTNLLCREASTDDVPAMARSRLSDPAAGPADESMAAPRSAFVAVAYGAVVGYIAGHLTRRFERDGEVQYLFVAPGYRRIGVAGQLLRAQGRWFRDQGVSKICVNVDPANAGACAFYARQGATELRRAWFVWSDIGALISVNRRGDR